MTGDDLAALRDAAEEAYDRLYPNGRPKTPDQHRQFEQAFAHAARKSAERSARRKANDEAHAAERRDQRQRQQWADLVGAIGRRHANCRFENFIVEESAQEQALSLARAYADRIVEAVEDGEGLILFGSVGTGKDHLCVAVLHAACRADVEPIRWINGPEWFARLRDDIDRDSALATEERRLREMADPALLAISEPIPWRGGLTEFQRDWLGRVVDLRWRSQRPTIVTLNVEDRAEFYSKLGQPIADRLQDGAVTIHCNWPSRRKKQNADGRLVHAPKVIGGTNARA